jgi:hypothetical protein
MNPLANLCIPRKTVFDKSKRDTVLDISDLVENKINPKDFFEENFLTQGMKGIYQSLFRRFEGKSDDGIFKLTQSMGGGKTHTMIALGLFAQHPEYRDKVMGDVYKTPFKGKVKVIGFSGRENPKYGIWGYIAEQLGKKELFKDYYDPLEAPGQSAWINLLKGEPTLILLDELPPYFQGAKAKQVGDGNLADVTTQALSNLLIAIGKEELKNVALVISDLRARYSDGSAAIEAVLEDYAAEVQKIAKDFIPVQQTGDELYHILRIRLFSKLPQENDIEEIAEAYSFAMKEAKQMDITTESPERFKVAIRDSFPFHPGIKDLYARFKENSGFQQTRGMIRLMRTIVADMFDPKDGWAKHAELIAPYDYDLNDSDTQSEIIVINSKLTNAISHDIAAEGDSVAESLDDQVADNLATKTARLILISSLANVPNAVRGLKDVEIIRNLVKPGLDISRIKADVLTKLQNQSWYLHIDREGNFLYRDVQNIVAKLTSISQTYNNESIRKELMNKLNDLFDPKIKDCYQKIYALPALDEIQLEVEKVSLVIYLPYHGGGLHPDLQKLYDDTPYQNRVLFLTGDTRSAEAIYDNARSLKGIEFILAEMRSDKVATNDHQYLEAEKLRENILFNFMSAVKETFVKIYYPTKRGLLDANFLMQFQGNDYNGEVQIKETLKGKRKFTVDIASDMFQKYVEQKLFGTQKSLPWNDVRKRAATNTDWIWHKTDALDQLKTTMLKNDLWRESGGWIEIGPFPPPPTSVQVKELSRNDNTGEMTLTVKPMHGDTVFYEVGGNPTEASARLDLSSNLVTTELKIGFLCIDGKGKHDKGVPVFFENRITIKHRIYQDGDKRMLELKALPKGTITYTTEGSDPFSIGGTYKEPFEVPAGVTIVLAGAKSDSIKSAVQTIRVPLLPGQIELDKEKPARMKKKFQFQATADTFQWLSMLKKFFVKVSGLTISLNGNPWLTLDIDPGLIVSADQVEKTIAFLRENLIDQAEVGIETEKLHFEKGQQLLDYIRETKGTIKEEEIEQ